MKPINLFNSQLEWASDINAYMRRDLKDFFWSTDKFSFGFIYYKRSGLDQLQVMRQFILRIFK